MVNKAVNHEQQLDDIERSEKDSRRTEAMQLQEHYKLGKSNLAAEEKKIDDMTQVEEQKQWSQKESKWKQEQDARVQLMSEVYESRATHVEHKKRIYWDNKDAVKRDMDDL